MGTFIPPYESNRKQVKESAVKYISKNNSYNLKENYYLARHIPSLYINNIERIHTTKIKAKISIHSRGINKTHTSLC